MGGSRDGTSTGLANGGVHLIAFKKAVGLPLTNTLNPASLFRYHPGFLR